jgi:hypothetical protein
MKRNIQEIKCDNCKKDVENHDLWTITIERPITRKKATGEFCPKCAVTLNIAEILRVIEANDDPLNPRPKDA